ncbi:alpha/beta hydrolase [Sphingomonas sp. HDW15A]|nr:alpha/beta hydrolase [Sphingomonas sp. HDW15A]
MSHTIESSVLHERRTVTVVLPPSYAKQPERKYPMLFVIDGGVEQDLLHVAGVAQLGAMWGRSGDAIVVGIETKDRRRELVGPTADPELLKKYPTAGQSAAFRRFLATEVRPVIERTYRANGKAVVIGESLAGLFIVETYMDQPELFDGYAAIDPSLWWDKEALSRRGSAAIGRKQADKRLYLAMAKEQSEEPAAMRRLADKAAATGAHFCLAERPDLTHATIYQQLSPQALQFLLPPAEPPAPEFGFEVKCSPKS